MHAAALLAWSRHALGTVGHHALTVEDAACCSLRAAVATCAGLRGAAGEFGLPREQSSSTPAMADGSRHLEWEQRARPRHKRILKAQASLLLLARTPSKGARG